MKKILLIVLFCTVLSHSVMSQRTSKEINILKNQLLEAKDDSVRFRFMDSLARGYRFSNVDSSLFYNDMAVNLANKMGKPGDRAQMLSLKGATLLEAGSLPESMKFEFEALNIGEKIKDTITTGIALNRIGNIYMELGDYGKANEYYFRSKDQCQLDGDTATYYNELSNIGNIYELSNMPDSALYYQQLVYNESLKHTTDRGFITWPEMMFRMGNAYKLKGDNEKALEFYKKGIDEAYIDNDIRNLTMNNLFIAKLYKEMNQPDSTMKYAENAFNTAQSVSFKKGIYDASSIISELFKNKQEYDSAYKYSSIADIERDSLYGAGRFREMQHLILNQQEIQQQLQQERDRIDSRNRTIVFLVVFLLAILIAFYLWNNNRKQKKVNATLREQQLKISSQNIELGKTLNDLKSTQSQLIQSEKMASLGELTAGIAHEIQNPLNFVNNFSDVNKELLIEMKDEMEKGNTEDAKAIANDVIENEEKINHHGKRAGDIVKGMLQHSRTSTGVKEPTDINALADEYLRLSYHGLRAKDKSFNATMKTDFDESIGKINIVSQDIGRVLLNLYNNAFYAVNERRLSAVNEEKNQNSISYKPTVSVSTSLSTSASGGAGEASVLISVTDNGNGIPETMKQKIFQPFFTTKPTGQGTGLGLSLSYDIIKADGGEIKVESKEGEGTTFIITLPQP